MNKLFLCIALWAILPFFAFSAPATAAEQYIQEHVDLAFRYAKTNHIPVSICLAQALLESGAGNSALSQSANNHFGMKKGGNWKGSTFAFMDDETDKNGRPKCSSFRQYPSAEFSYMDYAENLRKNKRYRALFQLNARDYVRWAQGLQRAGYASHPGYAQELIKIIQKYRLDLYDAPQSAGVILPLCPLPDIRLAGPYAQIAAFIWPSADSIPMTPRSPGTDAFLPDMVVADNRRFKWVA